MALKLTKRLPKSMQLIAAGVAVAATVTGCGGGGSNDAGNGTPASPTPAAVTSPYVPRHHRHHGRHGRGSHEGYGAAAPRVAASGGSYPCNDSQFLADRQGFASGSVQGDQEVDVCGVVTKVLPQRETRSGSHGYYYVQVAPGSTIEIVSDLGEMDAPAWPWVKVGDYSYVQGRYYYDSSGRQGIDWTHHGTSRSWPSAGYVVVGGVQYK
jgi:hypothetical protein